MAYSTPEQLAFHPVAGHTIRADFEGGALSSDFGALLLRGIDRQIGLTARHCQVVGDDSVTRQQKVLSGRDCHRLALEAARFVPVISAQLSNRCRISLRYSSADSRGRLGQKCWAIGPYADKNRWACPADLNPFMRCSRWRVGRCEFSPRLLR